VREVRRVTHCGEAERAAAAIAVARGIAARCVFGQKIELNCGARLAIIQGVVAVAAIHLVATHAAGDGVVARATENGVVGTVPVRVSSYLGHVDGFDEDEGESESDDGGEAALGLLAAQGDPLEALELAEALLDAGTALVKRFREEGGPVLGVRFERDGRRDAPRPGERPVGLGVITFVGESGAWRHIRPQIQQQLEQRAVADLAAGQVEGERLALEVALEVDLGGEAAARSAEGLALLPPFAPAAETWARTTVESNICTRWAVRLSEARVSKNSSNTPAWRSRQNLFQTLFQGPNSAGRARQEILCTVK